MANVFLIILKKLFDISGQVAVVTGGGGVLCGEMAKALGAAGCKVARHPCLTGTGHIALLPGIYHAIAAQIGGGPVRARTGADGTVLCGVGAGMAQLACFSCIQDGTFGNSRVSRHFWHTPSDVGPAGVAMSQWWTHGAAALVLIPLAFTPLLRLGRIRHPRHRPAGSALQGLVVSLLGPDAHLDVSA